jgi:hypothetical protein
MTEEEKVQLAALSKRVFDGEELAGQLKELHDHLKAKERAIFPAQGKLSYPMNFVEPFDEFNLMN